MADDGNVKVFCRVRPPNEREGGATAYTKKCVTVPSADPLQQTVLLQLKGMGAQAAPKTFTFDRVFHEHSSQNEVFELVGVPITKACLEGYNGTIFAYGQTGSGKTFTMQGPDDVIDADAREASEEELGLRGLVPRVFDYLFQNTSGTGALRVPADGTRVEHTFACSFMEIYNERVYDLLDHGSTRDAAGLTLRENGRKGVSVEGLIESVVTNAKQAAELMAVGARNRRVGQTAMNRESSRSHSVFVLQIQSKETTAEGITRTRLSRFNLVDLAGSERQKNTEAAGERLKEAGSINKSLSALGNVIMGLVEQSAGKNRHVHYRDSKLTFLLKDSLGGNSKTFMIATVSPAEDSSHETLSTLKFAQRAKLIRNNAVINEDTSGSVLVLQEEILRLRRQLQEARTSRSAGPDFAGEMRLADEQQAVGTQGALVFEGARLRERLEELETSLAFAIEKNESLMRTNGQLSVRSGHMQALCSELKRNVSSLKLRLRLRGGPRGDDIAEYESSADAIEWRMKFEELEETFVELQDRLRASGSMDAADSTPELQRLSIVYETLAKQFAHVIREKNEMSRRLENQNVARNDEEDKLAHLEAEMMHRSVEFESRLNSVLAANAAAEANAEAASLELLHSKQKEAAWKVDQQQTQLLISQLQTKVTQLETDVATAQTLALEEKQKRVELEMRLTQAHTERVQQLESHLAAKMTDNFELERAQSELQETVAALRAELGAKDAQNSELLSTQHAKSVLIDELTSSVNNLKLGAEKMTDRIGALQEEILKSSKLLQIAEGALRECKEEMAERADEYNTKITTLQSQCADLDAQREKAVADSNKAMAELQDRHRVDVEERELLAQKAASDHKAVVDQLHVKIKEWETRLAKTIQHHQELADGLRREHEAADHALAAEKELRVRERQEAQRQHDELVQKHSEEMRTLDAAAAKQRKEDDATITALTRTVEAKRETIMERDRMITELEAKRLAIKNELNTTITEVRGVLRATEFERDELKAQTEVLAERIESQREQIGQCEDTIASGLKEIEGLEGKLRHATDETEKLRTDLEKAMKALDDADVDHKNALSSLQAAHKTEIEKFSSEAAANIEKLEADLRFCSADVDAKTAEIERLKGKVKDQLEILARFETEVASEQELKTVVQGKLAQATADLQERDSIIVEKNDQIARVTQQLDAIQEEAEEERVRLSGRIQLLEADLKDLTRAHDVLTSSHSALMKLQKDTIGEKSLAEEANAEHLRRIEDLSSQVENQQSCNSSLSATVQQLERDLHAQANVIEEWAQKKKEADTIVADLKRLVTQRDDELDEKDSEISGMEETIENLEAAKEQGIAELDKVNAALDNLKKEHLSTTNALEKANATLVDMNSKLKAKENEYRTVDKEHKAAQSRLEDQLKSLTSDLDFAKQVISSQKVEIDRDAEAMGRLSSQVDQLNVELQDAAQKVVGLELTVTELRETLRTTTLAKEAAEESLAAKLSELNDCKLALKASQMEIDEALNKMARSDNERMSQVASWQESKAALTSTIQELQQRLDGGHQSTEELRSEAAETRRALENDITELRKELDHASEKVSRQRKRNDTLVESNRQLSQDLAEKTATATKHAQLVTQLEEQLAKSRTQQSTTDTELQTTKSELSATKNALMELEAKYSDLSNEFNSAKDGLKRKQADWEKKDKEIQGRESVIAEIEVHNADESRKLADEKVLVAQRKKEAERIKRDYEQYKTRVEELEVLKIQLSKEKEKYRREVNILTIRLDQISKENDKLVGHDNKRQKIQHHIKVKEENNRLQAEVRLLTEEKLKLEVRVGRLEMSLKEKENLMHAGQIGSTPRSPSASKSSTSIRSVPQSVSSTATSFMTKTSSSESIDSSARKRLRSRNE